MTCIREQLGFLLIGLLITGCGRSSVQVDTGPQPAFGPNGGVLIELPDDLGFAEIYLDASAVIGAKPGDQVVARFTQPDMRSPLASPPADVQVVLETPEGNPIEVALSPGTEPGQFVSQPAASPYELDPLIGTLKATVGGQIVEKTFAGR